jgi:hypothetical protein
MIGPIQGRALLVATLCTVVWPAAARAAETIEYEAAAGCPDRGAFLAAAARKAPGKQPAKTGPLKVEVRATLAGYTGVLERAPASPGEAPAPRVLSAARCEDVVEALALTLALSLVPPPERVPEVAIAAAAPAPQVASRRRLTLGAGLQAGRFVGGAPMLGATVAVGLARAERDAPRWSLGLEGRVRLSWNRSDVVLAPRRARFELMAAALELCPLHLNAGRARVGLCGLVEGGRLGGEGIAIAHPQWGRSGWLALGGGPELAVALTPRWHLVGAAFVTRPLRQTRFVFAEPAEPVARTASVAVAGSLAVAVHFP